MADKEKTSVIQSFPKMAKDRSSNQILIVDDEPNILVVLEYLIRQQGYRVLRANNGTEALKVIEKEKPSIIVLDVMMPEMDGFELARRIRRDERFDDIRIIFLTAKGTEADQFEGYANGGEVYLTKPFDNEELVTTINEVLEFDF